MRLSTAAKSVAKSTAPSAICACSQQPVGNFIAQQRRGHIHANLAERHAAHVERQRHLINLAAGHTKCESAPADSHASSSEALGFTGICRPRNAASLDTSAFALWSVMVIS